MPDRFRVTKVGSINTLNGSIANIFDNGNQQVDQQEIPTEEERIEDALEDAGWDILTPIPSPTPPLLGSGDDQTEVASEPDAPLLHLREIKSDPAEFIHDAFTADITEIQHAASVNDLDATILQEPNASNEKSTSRSQFHAKLLRHGSSVSEGIILCGNFLKSFQDGLPHQIFFGRLIMSEIIFRMMRADY